MRLLHFEDSGKLGLILREGTDIPPYAILSHTWGPDNTEVTFQDLIDGSGEEKVGYRKIRFCGEQAARDGLQYFWVDSCCIDKSSSQELTEAINSMFRWYRGAEICYVYLSDVLVDTSFNDAGQSMSWELAFEQSRWFTRGWTLQELLAPASVQFFSDNEHLLGDKKSLESNIHQITGIAIAALRGNPMTSFTVDERMLWAAKRQTKREEDAAYSLLGIFDVHMPLIYSEGREKAMGRLRRKIQNTRGDSQLPNVSSPTTSQSKYVRQALCTVPFGRDPDFVGRPKILDWVREKHVTMGNRAALIGLGGVGKSQLAIQYCHEVRAASPQTWVFWVHAGTPARFEEGYRRIAEATKMEDWDNPRANVLWLVRNWLSDDLNGPWLMVIDNADDASVFLPSVSLTGTTSNQGKGEPLFDFIPYSTNGSILITSRSRDVAYKLTGNYATIAEVTPMDAHDSLALFQKKLKSKVEEREAIELIAALDYMPLAITQAAAFIMQRAPRMSVTRYLSELRNSDLKGAQLLKKDVGDNRRDVRASNSILKTWQISFEHIRREVPTAAGLLSLMSLFDRQGIPESLLINQYQTNYEEDLDFEDDIYVLQNYSFVKIGHDRSEFEMHRLVQYSMKKWLELHDKIDMWKGRFLSALYLELPDGSYENWKKCQKLFPHAEVALEYQPTNMDHFSEWASVMYKAAWYADKRGKYEIAEKMNRRALIPCEETLGREHRLTLYIQDNLARVLSKQGRYKEAEEERRRHLEICETYLGLDDMSTLTSVDNLGLVLMKQNMYYEAEVLHRRAFVGKEKAIGPGHPHTLISLSYLANALSNQGKYKEAEELQRRDLEETEKLYGPDHPETLISADDLGIILGKQGFFQRSEALHRRSLAGKEKVLGLDHPDTLTSIAHIALVLANQGFYSEAEAMYLKAVKGREKVLGPGHPSTLNSVGNLGWIMGLLGRFDEAAALQRRAVDGKLKIYGLEHPETRSSLSNLRFVLERLGKHEEVLALDRRAREREDECSS